MTNEKTTTEQPGSSVQGEWVCGFCRQTYTLDAICCHAQRQFRAATPEPVRVDETTLLAQQQPANQEPPHDH